MSSDKNDIEVFIEHVDSKFDAIMEVMLPMRDDVESLKNDMDKVKADINVIKAAVTDNSEQLNHHETRITHLEAG